MAFDRPRACEASLPPIQPMVYAADGGSKTDLLVLIDMRKEGGMLLVVVVTTLLFQVNHKKEESVVHACVRRACTFLCVCMCVVITFSRLGVNRYSCQSDSWPAEQGK